MSDIHGEIVVESGVNSTVVGRKILQATTTTTKLVLLEVQLSHLLQEVTVKRLVLL